MHAIAAQERAGVLSRGMTNSSIAIDTAPGQNGLTVDDQIARPNEPTTDGGLHGQAEERQERRGGQLGGGGDKTRYQMREKLLSIGDDFWIENDRGENVFKVDGKALRVRQTLILEERSGTSLAKIQERMLHIKDSMCKLQLSSRQDCGLKYDIKF